MKATLKKLKGLFHPTQINKNFPGFITAMTFPSYKGLEKSTRIGFDFPITVFVGQNGCGKSTVLSALETAPVNTSLSLRWFSTAVDPISDATDGDRPSYWYEYFSKEASRTVQVLNMRIKKKGNPDYWESSRPVLKYGMDPMPDPNPNGSLPGRTKTRWKGVERNLLYMDFRSELSAFDKYFHFETAPRKTRYSTKQDYIRFYSKYLKEVFDGELKSRLLRNKEKVHGIYKLTDIELTIISEILGKQYTSALLVEHSFYKNRGYSVYFTSNEKGYSEAFAGSGEMSVVKLVHQIVNAEEASLVLLDEPEVSLHPGAQKKLVKFLLEECVEKRHQIVICTHSPAIVEELPSDSIKVFVQNANGNFDVINNVQSELAFQYIGHNSNSKIRILVEDLAAQQLLNKVLDLRSDDYSGLIEVVFHPGGAKDLFKESLVFSRNNIEKTYFFFDGDQKLFDIPSDAEIPDVKLDELITNSTGINIKEFAFCSDSQKQEQIIEEKRKFLSFLKGRCFFLPGDDPEDTIWDASNLAEKPVGFVEPSFKDKIKRWAENEIDEVKADTIKIYRERLLKALDKEHQNVKDINSSIDIIVSCLN